MRRISALLSLGLLVAVSSLTTVSCSDDDLEDENIWLGKVATYNAGLADNYVPLVDERLPEIIDFIDSTAFDALCMTEVWSEDDVLAIAESSDTPYANYFWVDTTEEPQPPSCTEELVADLQACAEAADCENDPAGLVGCAASNCGDELDGLTTTSPDCLGCLASQLEAETMDEMMTACVEEGGGTYNQGGRNGLLLLSQHDFVETDSLSLSSYINFRAVLYGSIDVPALGMTHVFCTHIATPVAGLTYAGEYDSWEDENAQQTLTILDWIDEKAPGGQVVLMGDFNNSPEIGDLSARYPENYQLVLDEGYVDPYATSEGVECTWCSSNTLIEETQDRVIDHVFMRGFADTVTYAADRFADELVEIQVDGSPQQSNLSDHFGIGITVLR